MATDVDEGVKRLQIADDLSDDDPDPESEDTQSDEDKVSAKETPSVVQDQARHPNDVASFDELGGAPTPVAAPSASVAPPALTIPTPTPESPSGPTDVQTDPETGTPYVVDTESGQKIPHAELATPADEETFKPGDVTLPKATVSGTGVVPRAQLIDPDPDAQYLRPGEVSPDAATPLVKKGIALPPKVEKGVGLPPKVQPGQLVDPDPDQLYTEKGTEAPVAKGVALPPKVQPAQPVTDAGRPSVAGGGEGGSAIYQKLLAAYKNSGLVGTVPADGARWGITTGSAEEWARFGTAVAAQESSFNPRSTNLNDPGGSFGVFQYAHNQVPGGNAYNVDASVARFVSDSADAVAHGGIQSHDGMIWRLFGSIRRPQEALSHMDEADRIAGLTGQAAQPAAPQNPNDMSSFEEATGVKPGAPVTQQAGGGLRQLTPEEATQAATQRAAIELDNLKTVTANNPNSIDLYKQLDQPIRGVSDATRQNYQTNLKSQIIASVKDKFGITDDNAAWTKATSDPNAIDVAQNFGTKVLGNLQNVALTMQKGVAGVDALRVRQYLDLAMPNASEADQHAYLTKLFAMPIDQRIAEVSSKLPTPTTGMPATDPQEVLSALDRISDSAYQTQQNASLAAAKATVQRNLASDPRLVGSLAEKITDPVAQLPALLTQVGFPIVLAASISDQEQEKVKAAHPDWNEDQVNQAAAGSTLVQIFGQEIGGKLMAAGMGAFMNGVTGPIKRALIQTGGQMAGNAAIGAGTQAGSNIASGKPIQEGVGEAAVSGAIQGAVTGIAHGGGELIGGPHEAPAEATPPLEAKPEPAPTVPAPTAETVPESVPSETEAATPAPVTPTREPGPITAEEILGPHPEDHIDDPHVQQDVISVVSHNIFPDLNPDEAQELADRVSMLSDRSLDTQKFQNDLMRFLPADTPTNFGSTKRLLQAYAAFRDGPTEYTAKEIITAQKAYNEARQPGVPASMLKLPIMTRDVQVTEPHAGLREIETRPPLYEPPPKPGREAEPSAATAPKVTATEPWVSEISNQRVAPRVASGELGAIPPGQGFSTPELVNAGLAMRPEETSQHISDLLHGTGDPVKQAAAVRAEEARLSQRSAQASKIADANPNDQQAQIQSKNARDEVTNFHKTAVAKVKTIFHGTGMALQDSIPTDLSTYNGHHEEYVRQTNKAPPPNMEEGMRNRAEQIKKANDSYNDSMQKIGDEITKEKAGSGKKIPSADEIEKYVMEKMKTQPCKRI